MSQKTKNAPGWSETSDQCERKNVLGDRLECSLDQQIAWNTFFKYIEKACSHEKKYVVLVCIKNGGHYDVNNDDW